jgi:hypothetical protein
MVRMGGVGDVIRAGAAIAGHGEHPLNGRLRDVYFDPAQLRGHTERTYHPGE